MVKINLSIEQDDVKIKSIVTYAQYFIFLKLFKFRLLYLHYRLFVFLYSSFSYIEKDVGQT